MKKLVILIAAMALVCFSVPAMAVDWNFYGSARMATYYTSQNNPGGIDIDGLQWNLQGNSRLGAKIKAESVNAQVELAVKSVGGGGTVDSRRIFATWNFGAGKLKVGKDYTPIDQFISGQVFDGDAGLLGIGTQYGSRRGQLGLEFGGFEISFSELVGNKLAGMEEGEVKNWTPRIDASWGMSFDSWNFGIQGGYNFYSVKDAQGDDGAGGLTNPKDVDVTSYTIGGDVGFNFGPAYVKAAGSYGQNWGNAGYYSPGSWSQESKALWKVGTSNTDDTTSYQGALVGGFKMSDMISFEAGVGARHDDPDGKGTRNSDSWNVYAQSVIALAPGVFIIPEAGYFAEGNEVDGDKKGNSFYLGGKWQIDF
jgi:hypothetical protein